MSTTGARVNDWLHPVMGVVAHAPITPTNNTPIAQLVEQRTFNPVVTGSNPVGCTN